MTRFFAFDGPTANEAYDQAPELETEAATVARLLLELEPEHRPDFYGPVLVSERREVLLRAAAVADRRWWADRTDEALWAAVRAAEAFRDHDRAHRDEVAGPYPPDSIEWDGEGGGRAYTRQEYLMWLTVPRWLDPADPVAFKP